MKLNSFFWSADVVAEQSLKICGSIFYSKSSILRISGILRDYERADGCGQSGVGFQAFVSDDMPQILHFFPKEVTLASLEF